MRHDPLLSGLLENCIDRLPGHDLVEQETTETEAGQGIQVETFAAAKFRRITGQEYSQSPLAECSGGIAKEKGQLIKGNLLQLYRRN